MNQTIEADALMHPIFGHMAWGWFCPECDHYTETVDTTREYTWKCESCGETFTIEYPGYKHEKICNI